VVKPLLLFESADHFLILRYVESKVHEETLCTVVGELPTEHLKQCRIVLVLGTYWGCGTCATVRSDAILKILISFIFTHLVHKIALRGHPFLEAGQLSAFLRERGIIILAFVFYAVLYQAD